MAIDMTDPEVTRICVIGAGPRGLCVLERLAAQARLPRWRERTIQVHLVDPRGAGGQVWRPAQDAELLMNTVASQITLFSDDSVDCEGPVVPGPSLHQWAALLDELGSPEDLPERTRQEVRNLGPDTYPTRRLYGHYLVWVLDRLRATAPANLRITPHPAVAVALHDTPGGDGTQTVALDDGTVLTGLDSVVLAQGHAPMAPGARERELTAYAERHGLLHLPPGNPADADYGAIAPGERVALLGMGLTCFDIVALLTTGRGGTFQRAAGRLVYQRSGQEPVLHLASRRGIPYHARGENEKGVSGRHDPLFLTPAAIDALRRRHRTAGPLSFRADVWPLISAEVRAVYYHALLAERGDRAAADAFLTEFVAVLGAPDDPAESPAEDALLTRHGVPRERRWDWSHIERPYGDRAFTGPDDYRRWLLAHLREDLAEARRGNVTSPLKAALDVLRDLRNEIRLVVDHAGLGGASYRDELSGWYTPLNAYLSIGPPARRIEELIALIEAGVVEVTGPGVRVEPDPHGRGFRLGSTRVPGPATLVTALVDARLPEFDLRATTDPLLRQLLGSGQCAPYRIPDGTAAPYETGGVAVTTRPYHLLDRESRAHPRRLAFGVPTEGVHWVTAAGIRPGVNSVIVGDSDAIAHTCLVSADARIAAARARRTPYLHRHVPLAWLPTSGRPLTTTGGGAA
ncbi:FAD/NAD(P)-binding protein [Streptomyces sp. NPDC048290]|uniref:FAD/NAD(P)-binding protein n=1 Tax=Streptomyces sp. NPDC048290 TaxID=3155811 RepID=UPI0034260332